MVDSSPTPNPSNKDPPPTYTTAGTLYDPGAAQPLQPPTRRGRSFRWSSSSSHSEASLNPKTALVSAQLKPGGGLVTTATSLEQYTPLQQNYDRAVSPSNDPDHQTVRVQIHTPSFQPFNGMRPSPLFTPVTHDSHGNNQRRDTRGVGPCTIYGQNIEDIIMGSPELNEQYHNNPIAINATVNNATVNNPTIANPIMNNAVFSNPIISNPSMNNAVLSNPIINNPSMNNPILGNPIVNNPNANYHINNYFLANPGFNNPGSNIHEINNHGINSYGVANHGMNNYASNSHSNNMHWGNVSGGNDYGNHHQNAYGNYHQNAQGNYHQNVQDNYHQNAQGNYQNAQNNYQNTQSNYQNAQGNYHHNAHGNYHHHHNAHGNYVSEASQTTDEHPGSDLDPGGNEIGGEGGWNTDILQNMTVKSLQNLASYPNPNQKRAQKILLQGAKITKKAATSCIFDDSFKLTSLEEFIASKEAEKHSSSRSCNPPMSEMPPHIYPDLLEILEGPPSYVPEQDAYESVPTTLATGPGAPRPLTAGPPGQRQYRPVARRSTPPKVPLRTHNTEQEVVMDLTQVASAKAVMDAVDSNIAAQAANHLPGNQTSADEKPNFSSTVFLSLGVVYPPDDYPPRSNIALSTYKKTTNSSEPASRTASHKPKGFIKQVYTGWRPDNIIELEEKEMEKRSIFEPGTDRLSLEELTARNTRINSQWYGGVGLDRIKPRNGKEGWKLCGPLEDPGDGYLKVLERLRMNKYGAVGDGRPSREDTTKKSEYVNINEETFRKLMKRGKVVYNPFYKGPKDIPGYELTAKETNDLREVFTTKRKPQRDFERDKTKMAIAKRAADALEESKRKIRAEEPPPKFPGPEMLMGHLFHMRMPRSKRGAEFLQRRAKRKRRVRFDC